MEVLKLLDRTLVPGSTSDVIPARLNKDGSVAKSSQAESLENFSRIRDFANRKVKELGNAIVRGGIKAEPYAEENRNACTFCPYGGICGFDRKIPGYEFRRLRKMNLEDVLNQIIGQEKGDL